MSIYNMLEIVDRREIAKTYSVSITTISNNQVEPSQVLCIILFMKHTMSS